jgi:hypothetical protein
MVQRLAARNRRLWVFRPSRDNFMQAAKGWSMEKWFCWAGMGVAGFVFLLFVLDLFLAFPFGTLSVAVDILVLIACLVLGYLSWNAFRDLH